MNMFKLFVSDQFIICIAMEFILSNLIVFCVLLLCINKLSVLLTIVHTMNMVIWVFK